MTVHELDTPAALVDVDRLRSNLDLAATIATGSGMSLRPHVKTHKCVEIGRMQVDRGAVGLTVAKLGEAEVFADAGFDDLFVANEIVGVAKLARLVDLAGRVRLTVGTDSIEGAQALNEAARRAHVVLSVRIEVDTGLHRAGVRSVAEAVQLAARIADASSLRLEGIFTHEGHAYTASPEDRRAVCSAAASMMRAVAVAISGLGMGSPAISVGSTPGLRAMAAEDGIAELRPGVYALGDAMQCGLGAAWASCALTVLSTVVSRPDGDTAILDAGTKALAADRGPGDARHGVVAEYPEARFDWASEEHGHLDVSRCEVKPRIGDRVRVVPWHACATTNMHDFLYVVSGESVVAEWQVAARGRFR